MVYEVKVSLYIKCEGRGYFTFIPGGLDVRDKGYDCIISGAVRMTAELVGGDEVKFTCEESEAVSNNTFKYFGKTL